MSDITVVDDYSDLLPPEMLETLLEEVEESNKSNYISYGKEPRFENLRYVNSNKWLNDKGEFAWSLPDQREFIEELEDIKGSVSKLIGYVGFASIGAGTQKWDDSKKQYIPGCQLVGMHRGGKYITVKPDIQGLKQLYSWDNNYVGTTSSGDTYKGGYNPTVPSSLVKDFGLFGSKNGLCADCIRRGDNVLKVNGEVYLDPKTQKPITCDIKNSYIIFALTAFETTTIKVNKKDPKSPPDIITNYYTVSDLYDGEEFIFLKINLPKKTGLSGVWNSEERRHDSVGFATLCNNLARSKDPEIKDNVIRKLPYFNEISIEIVEGSPKNFLHFTYDSPNAALMRNVKTAVDKIKEETAEIVIVDADNIIQNTAEVVSNTDDDLPPLRTIKAEEDPEDNPFG